MTAPKHRISKAQVRRALLSTGRWAWIVISLIIALTTVFAANGGIIDPRLWAFPGLLAMTFPLWIILDIAAGIINMIWLRRWAAAQIAAVVLSWGAIWDFMPLNIYHPAIDDSNRGRAIKFMSYNTFGFCDNDDVYPDETNRTASAIISSGADIICVQEVGFIDDMPSRHLYTAQVDSINDIYPWCAGNDMQNVAVLSKYPLRELNLPQPTDRYLGWQGAEVDVKGEKLLVISVHLQSIGLSEKDKEIYHDLTEGNSKGGLRKITSHFYDKLATAAVERADQADQLCQIIDSLGYRNVIVSGDFNDIEGCYTERRLSRTGLKSAFTRAAFGPMITYHSDRFYFNIDHVMYKGAVEPVSYHRGSNTSSDHYPVYVTFLLGE